MFFRIFVSCKTFFKTSIAARSNTTGNTSRLNVVICSSTIYPPKKMPLMNSPSPKIPCYSKHLGMSLSIWQSIYQSRRIIQIEERCWKHQSDCWFVDCGSLANKALYKPGARLYARLNAAHWEQGWVFPYKLYERSQRFLDNASSFILIFMLIIDIFVVRCRTNPDLIHSLQQIWPQRPFF